MVTRSEIADLIVSRLLDEERAAREGWRSSTSRIAHFIVEDLLPTDIAADLFRQFPDRSAMRLKKSLREDKYVSAQMNECDPLLEEAIYAFQDPRIVELVGRITGIDTLEPDDHLYAGGISKMRRGQFLNPHLDNSHDKDRERWRVLNLLYYVTPDWKDDDGGELELWPDGRDGERIPIPCTFNRLVVMGTHEQAWHSVRAISGDSPRCCLSNYYFSASPLRQTDAFHVTSFRGRPEQTLRDLVLRADIKARMGLRKFFRLGIVENKHVYKR